MVSLHCKSHVLSSDSVSPPHTNTHTHSSQASRSLFRMMWRRQASGYARWSLQLTNIGKQNSLTTFPVGLQTVRLGLLEEPTCCSSLIYWPYWLTWKLKANCDSKGEIITQTDDALKIKTVWRLKKRLIGRNSSCLILHKIKLKNNTLKTQPWFWTGPSSFSSHLQTPLQGQCKLMQCLSSAFWLIRVPHNETLSVGYIPKFQKLHKKRTHTHTQK